MLENRCVETTTPGVRVNLFSVTGGHALPVTFGGATTSANVQVRNLPGLAGLTAVALHPGVEAAVPVAATFADGVLNLAVPLKDGCAMVRLSAP